MYKMSRRVDPTHIELDSTFPLDSSAPPVQFVFVQRDSSVGSSPEIGVFRRIIRLP